MNNFLLKLIAIVVMLIDHIGAIFFPEYLWIRVIGRVAFPIFCFLLIEGFHHTRNVEKYMIRLGIFALLSEIPFDLAFYGQLINMEHQNVFFTLFIGLVVVYFLSVARKIQKTNDIVSNILSTAIVIVGCYMANMLNTDYSYIGILLIVAFYLFRERKAILIISVIIITGLQGSPLFANLPIELYASIALIPISFYNGKKGTSMKYVFYGFYPVHLLCLYFIATYFL